MRRTRWFGLVVVSGFAVVSCGPTPGNGPGDIAARNGGSSTSSVVAPPTSPAGTTEPAAPTSWFWDGPTEAYVTTGAPPDCPTPLVEAGGLVDLSDVMEKYQPGRVSDGEYLINGSFRWSSADMPYPETITVTMPFDGYVTGAWQFLKSGAYLFGLNLVHPCGLMLRLSKMHEPSPEVKALLDQMGPAAEKDSRETFYTPGLWLTEGTVLATSVGVPPPNPQPDVVGAQLDVAILDLRTRNPQIPADFDFTRWSGSAAPQYVFYARCFYQDGYFAEEALIEAIPVGGSPDSDTCVTS